MTSENPASVCDYPSMPAEAGRIEAAPRRVRGMLNNEVVFDTTSATYVWEVPYYPQYSIPVDDVDLRFLVDEHHQETLSLGVARQHGLRVGDVHREHAARVYGRDAQPGIADTVRFEWAALDAWCEEDEEIFVHPRNPYTRVDAVRSHRHVRIESNGVVLAETTSPVLVFETGLPTRYYIDKTDVRFEHLVRSDTVSSCPYKGSTTAYWSVQVEGTLQQDLAWAYDYPTTALAPITGMVAFYNEAVDLVLDDRPLARPVTHFVD